MLTGPEPGITRDAIASAVALARARGTARRHGWACGAGPGSRRNSNSFRSRDTLRAIRFAEVVVLVVDATQMLERQDLTIARLVADEGRALVLAVNKWDLIEDKRKALEDLRRTRSRPRCRSSRAWAR